MKYYIQTDPVAELCIWKNNQIAIDHRDLDFPTDLLVRVKEWIDLSVELSSQSDIEGELLHDSWLEYDMIGLGLSRELCKYLSDCKELYYFREASKVHEQLT